MEHSADGWPSQIIAALRQQELCSPRPDCYGKMKDILITPNNTTESVAEKVVKESGRGCNLSVKMSIVLP
jgi:hypothetical protein